MSICRYHCLIKVISWPLENVVKIRREDNCSVTMHFCSSQVQNDKTMQMRMHDSTFSAHAHPATCEVARQELTLFKGLESAKSQTNCDEAACPQALPSESHQLQAWLCQAMPGYAGCRKWGTALSYKMPHMPHTFTSFGPPSQPVPSCGWWSMPQLRSSSSWRSRRIFPSSPQDGPQEF